MYLTELAHFPYFGLQYFCKPYSAHGHGILALYKAVPYLDSNNVKIVKHLD